MLSGFTIFWLIIQHRNKYVVEKIVTEANKWIYSKTPKQKTLWFGPGLMEHLNLKRIYWQATNYWNLLIMTDDNALSSKQSRDGDT